MNYRKVGGFILLLFVIISMGRTPGVTEAQSDTVKLGAVVGFTGFMAMDGPECIKGIEFKLDEIGWKVSGKKIDLIKEDGASVVNTYVDKAMKLVESDRVVAVLGPLFSPAGFAVANYLKKSRIPNIAFMEHDIQVLRFGGKNVFLHWGTLEGTGYYLGLYAYDKLGYKTTTALWPDNQSGEGLSQGFIKGFESKGGKIIQTQRFPADTMDFSPYLPSMKKADSCLFWDFGPFVAPFIRQYHDIGRKMPILMPLNTPASEIVLKEAGEASIGIIGIGPYTPLVHSENNEKFVEAFHKKYGVYPRAEHMGGYIAASVIIEAVESTRGDTSPDALIKALKKNKVDTPAGVVSYTPEGLGIGDLYLQKVIKIGDRYAWDAIDKYSQIIIDIPR